MTVAVKNPETTSSGVLDRLPVGIFVGVVYLLGSLAVLFKLLPSLWWTQIGFDAGSMASYALLYLVEIAAAVGLAYVGSRLVGSHPPRGLKAGIFLALVTLLVVVLLTRWASLWIEGWVYDTRNITESVGLMVTAAIGVVLLVVAVRTLFLLPTSEPRLVSIEEQGWFSTTSYKRSQGQRVRRGTIVAFLIIVLYGLWTMVSHKTIDTFGTKDWSLNIPFTGGVNVTSVGDTVAAGLLPEDAPSTMDRQQFRQLNDALKSEFVRIEKHGTSPFEDGQLVAKKKFEEVERDLKKSAEERKEEIPPTARAAEPARGTVRHTGLLLLPDVKYTLPLLLGALGLWVGWRAVNMPAFADFLIATEAELNKVSWTTRKRLIQDTIVVLVTLVMLTTFLFLVDILWGKILSWKAIGVLRIPESKKDEEAKGQRW